MFDFTGKVAVVVGGAGYLCRPACRKFADLGATVVVAGSIPGSTRTIAAGIYTYTEIGNDAAATGLLLVSVAIAFGALWCSNRLAQS